MFIRVVGKKRNDLFECDRVVETEVSLSFLKKGEVFVQLNYADEEWLHIYAMNENGQTVDSWTINPEGKSEEPSSTVEEK